MTLSSVYMFSAGVALTTLGLIMVGEGIRLLRWRSPGLDEDEKNETVALLKNALLADALFRHRSADFVADDTNDAQFAAYDGSVLPRPAGVDYCHACWTYLLPRRIDRNTPLYTPSMERKSDAVRKYLCEKLSSDDEAFRLLKACVASDIKSWS